MNRHLPTPLKYGDNIYGSLNLLHFETEKIVQKTKTLNLLLNDSIDKILIVIAIDNYQLNLGLSGPNIQQFCNVNAKYISKSFGSSTLYTISINKRSV